ncbi:hypothetical protein EBB07_27480 [Paenibacillaceae bacterium]|nr:hypothetical protein EBB07_27480 [Paenibacillaceae bacterium]
MKKNTGRNLTKLWLVTTIMVLAAAVFPYPTSAESSTSKSTPLSQGFIAVEGGHYYTMALRKDGTVWGWGRNLWGELGIQQKVSFSRATAPIRIAGLSGITNISVGGWSHNLAAKADGTVWQWGGAERPGIEYAGIYSLLPYQIEGVTDARTVAAGSYFGLALRKDGTVWSWEKIWMDPQIYQSEHESRKPAAVKGLKDIVQIVAGGQLGYALKKDGTVWGWRESLTKKGQYTIEGTSPVQVKGLNKMKQISLVGESLYGLDGNGKVWFWEQGQPAKALYPKLQVKQIVAQQRYVLLLTTSGEIYTYGETVTGKQGKVNHLPKIVSIGGGTYHNIAVSADGGVWGWGHNKFYEAGTEASSYGGMVYRPAQARAAIDVFVNGKQFETPFPVIASDVSVQVPIRAISQTLGASFSISRSDSETSYVVKYKGRTISFNQYADQAWEGSKPITLIERPKSVAGAVTVPYQLLSQGLGLNINWDSNAQVLTISDTKAEK